MKLKGIQVVDAAQTLAGSLVSRLMADHGADVIKIEPPAGSLLRQSGRALHAHADRGKRSVVLDLKLPAHQETARRLIDRADVFVESLKPGAVERLGLGYATLQARHPRLVYASVSGYGQTGPLRDVPAHDLSVRALAGALTVSPQGLLVPPDTSDGTQLGSLHALAGVLMALLGARATGIGDYVDLSIHDCALTMQPYNIDLPAGQPQPLRAFMTAYRTRDDRWVCLGGTEPAFVRAVLEGFARTDLVEAALDDAPAAQHRVHEALRGIFAEKSLADWVDWFTTVRAAFAPVLNLAEALAHPHTAARGMVLAGPDGLPQLASPIRFLDQPARPDLRVPSLGEHDSMLPPSGP